MQKVTKNIIRQIKTGTQINVVIFFDQDKLQVIETKNKISEIKDIINRY